MAVEISSLLIIDVRMFDCFRTADALPCAVANSPTRQARSIVELAAAGPLPNHGDVILLV
jgi:hypothetical protein